MPCGIGLVAGSSPGPSKDMRPSVGSPRLTPVPWLPSRSPARYCARVNSQPAPRLRIVYRSHGGENMKSRPAYYSKLLALASVVRAAEESGVPDPQPAYYLIRHVYQTPVDIRHYRNAAGEEGLLVGPPGETGLGPGTVTLQAIHFAGLLGASTIHVIGADMHFKAGTQHFYGENEYGTETVDGKRYHRLDVEHRLNPIVEVVHPESGQVVETTLHFRESAEFLDVVIRDLLPPVGIELTDFSHGLISTAARADVDAYMAS